MKKKYYKKNRKNIVIIAGIIILIVLFLLFKNIPSKSNFDSICGNEICEFDESIDSCFDDCKEKEEYCGDGECQSNEDENSCNEDCEVYLGEFDIEENNIVQSYNNFPLSVTGNSNTNLIIELNKKQRPISGGIAIKTSVLLYKDKNRASYRIIGCTLGGIIKFYGNRYGITAEHCVTKDIIANKEDIGNEVLQGEERIGEVIKIAEENNIDIALISLDDKVKSTFDNFLGYKIEGFAKAKKGMKVIKLGKITGITYGKVTKESVLIKLQNGVKFKTFEIEGINGEFVKLGDSGSLVITKEKPHRIVGINIISGNRLFDKWRNKEKAYAHQISEIIDKVSIKEFVGVHKSNNVWCYDSDGTNLFSKGNLQLFDGNGNPLINKLEDKCLDSKSVLENRCVTEEEWEGVYYIEDWQDCTNYCQEGVCL